MSYCVLTNMKRLIESNNSKKLALNNVDIIENYECVNRGKICPYNNQCHLVDQIYNEKLINVEKQKYTNDIGSCATSFRKRHINHKTSFNNTQYRSKTTLAGEVWKIRDNNENYEVFWSKPGNQFCNLGITEIYYIIHKNNSENLLNKRNELMNFG